MGVDRAEAGVLLKVEDLRVGFPTPGGMVHAVNGISYEVGSGETLGIVGESGSGKTVAALALMRLLPGGKRTTLEGSVAFEGIEVTGLSSRAIRQLRGADFAMIFQDPLTSLNPALTIERQMTEVICEHEQVNRRTARRRAVELLELVGIPDAVERIKDHPHQFSGGMRQRVMIAMALACNPKLIIADEPTTALDVTIQAQVLDLLKRMVQERNTALILITHDLGVVAGMCRRVLVMYGGTVVEEAETRTLFKSARHPYTNALLRSIPRLDTTRGEELTAIQGQPPDAVGRLRGCPFAPRCPRAQDQCRSNIPQLKPAESGDASHRVACFYPMEE